MCVCGGGGGGGERGGGHPSKKPLPVSMISPLHCIIFLH